MSNPNLQAAPVVVGPALDSARRVAVLIHGRGQDASLMLHAAQRVGLQDVTYVVPVAAEHTWYHQRFYDPVETMEPQLSWALETVAHALDALNQAGVPDERIVLGGFSQGACLVAEYVARNPRPLAGVCVLTGALIGTPEQRRTPGALPDLPMYFCCAENDIWVPIEDVRITAAAFEQAGAMVTFESLGDIDHYISDQGVAGLRRLLA